VTPDALVQEIVTFQDEVPPVPVSLLQPVATSIGMAAVAMEQKDHSVVSFLERPYKIGTFTWTPTLTPNASLFYYDFPNALFVQPAVKEKLSGFTFFRGDMEFRIQVNAQPFQQGRLLCVFVPYRANWADNNVHTSVLTLTGLTGYPHADLDLATTQTLTISVPFVCPLAYLPLTKRRFSVGSLQGIVYGQLAGGTGNVAGTVWARFKNVSVQIPTGISTYAITPPTGRLEDESVERAEAMVGSGETKSASMGPISGVADSVGKVAMAAKDVPLIGGYSSAIGLAARGVRDVATLFGFSKPTSEAPLSPMTVNLARNMANYNGVDTSKPLSVDANAALPAAPLFGSEVDEMAIKYICGTPNYLDDFSWSVSSTGALRCYPATPLHSRPASNAVLYPGCFISPHVSYVSKLFRRWRGSLRFNFRFVKTNYHSGRLRIAYVPGARSYYASDLPDLDKCYSEIVDIRERSEFEFIVPFVYWAPWSLVGGVDPTSYSPTITGTLPNHIPGYIVVEVINALQRPNTLVSDTVGIIVEFSAGDDFELAVPIGVPFVPALGVVAAAPPSERAEALMWMPPTRQEQQMHEESSVQLFKKQPVDDAESALASVGEKIVSIKQLMQRFNRVTTDTPGLPAGSVISIRPWAVVGRSLNSGTAAKGFETLNCDYYSYFSAIFAYFRGGMRIKSRDIFNIAPTAETALSFNDSAPQSFFLDCRTDVKQDWPGKIFLGTDLGPEARGSFAQNFHVSGRDGIYEVSVPYYCNTIMHRSCAFAITNDDANDSNVFALPLVCWQSFVFSNSDAAKPPNFFIWRAVADDFQFGFLTGCPYVITE